MVNSVFKDDSFKISQLFNVEGKITLITGGGGDIGGTFAKYFALNGAVIIIADINVESLERSAKQIFDTTRGRVDQAYLDISNEKSHCDLFDFIYSKYSKLDVLIHAAAIGKNQSVFSLNDRDIMSVLEVNLLGALLCNKHASQIMVKQRKGKIINIGSIGGIMAHVPGSAVYNATKAGIHQLTRSFAAELAKFNVNVNCIAPAWVKTRLLEGKSDEYFEAAIKNTPIGRICTKEELVGTALYLASDASNFITGQVIFVDGGWTSVKF